MTDPRFGDRLLYSIRALPVGSGVIVRHMNNPQRKILYDKIKRICRQRGHKVIVAGNAALAISWKADGYYGVADHHMLAARNSYRGLLYLASAHNQKEITRAHAQQAHIILLSPIFKTRSHTGERPLGIAQFSALASICNAPVVALGGMNKAQAIILQHKIIAGWAAIDGLIR